MSYTQCGDNIFLTRNDTIWIWLVIGKTVIRWLLAGIEPRSYRFSGQRPTGYTTETMWCNNTLFTPHDTMWCSDIWFTPHYIMLTRVPTITWRTTRTQITTNMTCGIHQWQHVTRNDHIRGWDCYRFSHQCLAWKIDIRVGKIYDLRQMDQIFGFNRVAAVVCLVMKIYVCCIMSKIEYKEHLVPKYLH